jgi:hypothetical protein
VELKTEKRENLNMHGTSKWMIKLAIFVTAIALATPALAGVVMFKGKVRTGFGTSTNVTDAANNALPACAPLNGNVYAPNTWGTLQAQGFAEQGTGTHPTLMFDAYEALLDTAAGTNLAGYAGGNGGAFPRYASTCGVFYPPFIVRLLRSRVQGAGAGWPGEAGTLGQNQGFDYGGASALSQTVPFYGTGTTNMGKQNITKGVRNFGGGLPAVTKGSIIWKNATQPAVTTGPIPGGSGVASGPGVQLGVNLAPYTNGTGMDIATYGILSYVNGYLPTGPNALGGGAATFRTSMDPQRLKEFGEQSSHTAKIATGNAFKLRTPGTVGGASGATRILTVPTPGGGTVMVPAVSSIQIRIAAGLYTSGTVQHSDQIGDYVTVRSAAGSDITGLAEAGGTTRKLQVVTPWSANIGGIGLFGLFPLPLGFGGISMLDYNIIPMPAPEPGALLSLGAGAIALLGLARARRR